MLICPRCNRSLEAPERYCPVCGAEEPLRGWPDDALIGRSIAGRYRVERRIGAGGMGTVYRAVDRKGGLVAVKTLHGQYAQSDEMVRRFRREARSAALLRGPQAVRVYDVGELPDGTLYYVMDLVEGQSLARWLRTRGPMSPAQAIAILAQLAEGLAEAHGIGLVHRDLKPDNLFIVDAGGHQRGPGGADPDTGVTWRLKILDFGIVKVLDARVGTVGETRPGRIFGTPEFMSPEQARGEAAIDHRSDIFSAGVVAFLLLTGRLPFDGATPQAAMMRRLGHDAPRMGEVCPERSFPLALEAIVARMLRRDPADRHASMTEVAAALAEVDLDAAPDGDATVEQRQVDLLPSPSPVIDHPSLSTTAPARLAGGASAASSGRGRAAGRRGSRGGAMSTRIGHVARVVLTAALFLAAMGAVALLLAR